MKNRNETKNFYNRIAKHSFEDWFDNEALLPTLRIFVDKLPESPYILDLGCGTGGESKRLKKLGARVIGIDFSESSIAIAREHLPDIEFMLRDIRTMEFNESTFNGVLEAGVLFHFNRDEQNQIIEKIYNILLPDGSFLSYYPVGNSEGIEEIEFSGNKYKRYSRRINRAEWITQVMNHGFNKYIIHEFNIGDFSCTEFIK